MDKILKRKLTEYGFFLGIVLAFSAAIIPLIYFSQNAKLRVYSNTIQNLLDEKMPDDMIKVNRKLKILSPFDSNAAVFELSKKDLFAVMLRIETLYGPKPAVFLYSENDIEFLGWALPQGKVEGAISNVENDMSVIYWKNKIPSLMKKAVF